MSSLEIETVLATNQHAKRLMATFYNTHKILASPAAEILQSANVKTLLKTMNDRQPKHLTDKECTELGQFLRYPVSAFQHYRSFQKYALNLLLSASNNSKTFDLSWNYVFVKPIMDLYTAYVKLQVFFVQLPNKETIVQLYNYCIGRIKHKEYQPANILLQFINARDSPKEPFKAMESELQPLNDHILTLFRGVLSDMQRIFSPSSSFDWKLLNMVDDPTPSNPGATFFKPEYLIMMDLDNITDWFYCSFLVNMQPLTNDSQLFDVLRSLMMNKPYLEMHGDFAVGIKELFLTMRKSKGKQLDLDEKVLERAATSFGKNKSDREYRRRKLASILEEQLCAVNCDKSHLTVKLVVILATLGFSNFEMSTAFHSATLKLSNKCFESSIISLLYNTVTFVSFLFKNEAEIKRFLVYNFHEYDAPYLDALIHSFQLPQVDFQRFEVIVDALGSMDIEEYDNEVSYDLSGLHMIIQKEMVSFNNFNTNHGVLHLAPLFNLISALHFRLAVYTDFAATVFRCVPLNTYWKFIPQLLVLSAATPHEGSRYNIILYNCVHYFSYDTDTHAEWPGYESYVKEYATNIQKTIVSSLMQWIDALQSHELNDLRQQTSYANLMRLMKSKQPEKVSRIFDVLPGAEGTPQFRKLLTSMYQIMDLISSSVRFAHSIGTIHCFTKELSLFNHLVKGLSIIMAKKYVKPEPKSPKAFLAELGTFRFIIQSALTAGYLNANKTFYSNLATLTDVSFTFTDRGMPIIGEKMGSFPTVYKAFYEKFSQGELLKSFYSNNGQSFMSLSKGSKVQDYASRAAFRDLHRLIGTSGCAVIDLQLARTFGTMFLKFVERAKAVLKGDSKQPTGWQQNPLLFPEAPEIIHSMCHMGAVLKLRQLLRSTIDVDGSSDPTFKFMEKKVCPHEDIVLLNFMMDSGSLSFISSPAFMTLFKALIASSYWTSLEYYSDHDSFRDNSHLMPYCFDAFAGALYASNAESKPLDLYKDLCRAFFDGIQEGHAAHATQKKLNYPTLSLHVLLDHLVKSSCYADYSILEPIVSYQYIRTVYINLMSKHSSK